MFPSKSIVVLDSCNFIEIAEKGCENFYKLQWNVVFHNRISITNAIWSDKYKSLEAIVILIS